MIRSVVGLAILVGGFVFKDKLAERFIAEATRQGLAPTSFDRYLMDFLLVPIIFLMANMFITGSQISGLEDEVKELKDRLEKAGVGVKK